MLTLRKPLTFVTLPALAVALLLPATAQAQRAEVSVAPTDRSLPTPPRASYFGPGDFELTLSGTGFSDERLDGGQFQVNGSLGYFVDEHIELSVRQGLGYTDLTNDFNGSTRVAVDYHFNLDRWQPFIGANIGYLYGGPFRDTWAAGPEAGVKYFVNDTTFIYGSLAYDFFFRNASNIDDEFNNGQFVYGVGIGFRW